MITTFTVAICLISILNITLDKYVIQGSANMAKKLLSFKHILNLYFSIAVFTSRNWNQKSSQLQPPLIKVFTVLIVTTQNTDKAPRFRALYIKTQNPLKNSQRFSNQSFVTKGKFALQLIMTYSNSIKAVSKGMSQQVEFNLLQVKQTTDDL